MNTETLTLSTELAGKGIILYLDTAGKLRCKAPDGILTPDVISAIKEHRDELVTLLAQEPETPAPGQHLASTPEKSHRPTADELRRWNNYYGSCLWYKDKNSFGDNPFFLALEYACLGDTLASSDWLSQEILHYYGMCKERSMLLGNGVTSVEPRQFTELVRLAYVKKNEHRLRALAAIFHEPSGVDAIVENYHRLVHPVSPARLSPARQDEPAHTPSTEPLRALDVTRRQWVTIFADIHAGHAITEQGTPFTFPADCSLTEFIRAATEVTPVSRVYLCGARPGGGATEFLRWLTDAGMLQAYTTDARGHYLDTQKPDSSVARYQHRLTHDMIDIRRVTSWLGDDRTPGRDEQEPRYTIEDARDTLALVTRYIQQYFYKDVKLSGTPGATFKRLWSEANRIAGKKFTPLPDELRALIHSNAGQGRIEFFSENSTGKLPGLYYYDGVFMYAALTWGLPTELATHDNEPVYAGKVPARYRIRFTVPAQWQHVGLFMTRRENGWFYPGKDEQGKTYETWVDGAELDLAYNLPSGMPAWDITILERIVFKTEKESSVSKPLTTITEKIIKIREHMARDARQDAGRAHLYKLASGSVRNILLHGIGSFNRQQSARSYILLDTEPAPQGYTEYEELDEHTRLYLVPTENTDTSMMHPEWAALIWARCRARMTKAALSLPYAQVIAIRTDAITVTRPVNAWENNTETGKLRRKWAIAKPLQAPANDEQLDNIQRKITRK